MLANLNQWSATKAELTLGSQEARVGASSRTHPRVGKRTNKQSGRRDARRPPGWTTCGGGCDVVPASPLGTTSHSLVALTIQCQR